MTPEARGSLGSGSVGWMDWRASLMPSGGLRSTVVSLVVLIAMMVGGPLSLPAAATTPVPVITSVLPGNKQVSVTWEIGGGGPTSGLHGVVVASPGGASCSASGPSCTVTGLRNATTYTFVVTVTDGQGGSTVSAPSQAALPASPSMPWQVAEQRAVAAGCTADPYVRANVLQWFTPPALTVSATASPVATITTDLGVITVRLEPAKALQSVNSFVFLSQQHYFDCVAFHRVITGFVDQTGDPTATGFGGPGYTLPDEFPPKAADPAHQFAQGDVAMANTGAPHSGGSQFFFVLGPSAERLPHKYALFGHIIHGLKVAEAINAAGPPTPPHAVVHRMLSVTIASS